MLVVKFLVAYFFAALVLMLAAWSPMMIVGRVPQHARQVEVVVGA